MEKICQFCKKEFIKLYFRSKKSWKEAKYCSVQCYWKSLEGGKHTEEHKGKIGLKSKGRKHSLEARIRIGIASKGRKWSEESKERLRFSGIKKGKSAWNKDKHYKLSEEAKENIIKAIIKRNGFFQKGELSLSWLGGKSFEPYGVEFNNQLRKQIRQRDNYECQECKIPKSQLNYKLNVHHIDYNKRNNNPDNLISLCRSCHSQTNFIRKDWVNYFKNKLIYEINKI